MQFIESTGKAEVVLLITTLGISLVTFNDCVKAKQLLECKEISFTVIDCNTDLGKERPELDLVNDWRAKGILRLMPNGKTVKLPQVLIDGCSIGSFNELQELEDIQMLDSIIELKKCPSCFQERENEAESCPKCNLIFIKLMKAEPKEYNPERPIQRDCQSLEIAQFAILEPGQRSA